MAFSGKLGGFHLGVRKTLQLNVSLHVHSTMPVLNSGAHFSVGKIIYWVGNFGQWAGLIHLMDEIIY